MPVRQPCIRALLFAAMPFSLLDLNIFLTLGCWSVWGILDKKALVHSTESGVLARLYLMALWQVPLLWLYMKMSQPGFEINSQVWLWTGLAAIFQLASLASYLVAMTITDASLVLGATAAYPVVTQFLAVAFLGEQLLPMRTLGSVLIAAGVVAIGLSFDHAQKTLHMKDKIRLGLCIFAATFGWGIWGIFDKKAIEYGSPIEIWLAECLWECAFMVVAFVFAKTVKIEVELKNRRAWKFVLASAIALGIGRLTFLNALKAAPASYVIAITGCYPLFMYFMAMFFLKEHFNKVRFAGIALIVAGGAAVQWSLV